MSEASAKADKELTFIYDDVTIPIESQTEIMVPSDVVSETVVVTTTPYRKAMTGHVTTKESLPLTHDVCGTGEVVGESDGNFLPMQHDFSATNRTSSTFDIATTLQQLSSRNLRNVRSGVLEDFTRVRDRLKKREQRKNPEYRKKETAKARVRMANRRSDPILRAVEREKDRERRAKARQNEEVREKERERDKLYKKSLRQRSQNLSDCGDIVKSSAVLTCNASGTGIVRDCNASDIGIRDLPNVMGKRNNVSARFRNLSESLTEECSAMKTNNGTKIKDTNRTRNVNEIFIEDLDNVSETVVVVTENDESLVAEVCQPFNALERDTKTNCETISYMSESDLNKSDSGGEQNETVRIVNENGEEIVIFNGDVLNDRVTSFIENLLVKSANHV